MRRKTFDVLFMSKMGMAELALAPTMWRSLFYMTISVGAFVGVVVNVLFASQPLAVRMGLILGFLLLKIVGLGVFGCFLHGLIDACGGGAGNLRALLCTLGFTTLPFLVFVPVALMGVTVGGWAVLALVLCYGLAFVWSLFLVIRAVEAVYLLSFSRAVSIVLFAMGLLLMLIAFPLYLGGSMLVKILFE